MSGRRTVDIVRKRSGLVGTAVMAGLLAITAVPTVAAPVAAREVERERHGSCSGRSDWEFSLEKEGRWIEVDLEIDTNRVGRRWRIKIWHDGNRFFRDVRRTDGEGEIDIDRTVRNHDGTDYFRFRAVNLRSGEVCKGRLSI